MKHLIFFFWGMTLIGLSSAMAQKATFLIADAENHNVLPKVEVHSRLMINGRQYSNEFGEIVLTLAKDDVILIEKEFYYPLKLVVKEHKEFDYDHTIIIYLTPLLHNHQNQESSLKLPKDQKSFEYKFLNQEIKTNPADNALQFEVIEHEGASVRRANWTPVISDKHTEGFTILKINLSKPKKP